MYFSDFISDSVGIRTQDPQLRRLLLYPAELPNRSVLLLGSAGLIPKVDANIDVFVVICKICVKDCFGRCQSYDPFLTMRVV